MARVSGADQTTLDRKARAVRALPFQLLGSRFSITLPGLEGHPQQWCAGLPQRERGIQLQTIERRRLYEGALKKVA